MSFLNDFNKKFENYYTEETVELPDLPRHPLKWIEEARPKVEGRPRNFLVAPFWEDIYNDFNNNKMIIGGRQIFKSTYTTDILAYESTTRNNAQVCYVTFDDINKAGFSRQKLQIGTFESNPILSQYPRHGVGNVGEISLRNGSTIYVTTDHNQYRHVEGKSLDHVMLDEAQYQDIQYFERVVMTMMQTKGKITVCGIGGEAGSPYEDLWLKTDQRHWEYEDKFWREKLKFEVKDGKKQLIVGEYLRNLLRGRWVPKNPQATHWHGYHLPQEIFPTIPLTIDSAINDYDVDPQFSIEYQKKNSSKSMYISHVTGGFYHAQRRPITPEMVLRCMKPYRYMRLLKPREIAKIKDTWGDRVKISLGVDFGSGSPSQTVICILIKWNVKQPTSKRREIARYQMAFLDVRPAENQLDQAEYITKLFKKCKCDIGIGDLGYGANQIKIIQDGGANRKTGVLFEGGGSNMFYGCRTIADETKPLLEFGKKVDEHGEVRESVSIDKTHTIQEFIDFLEDIAYHPKYPNNEDAQRPRLMIPYEDEDEVDFLINDWTALTRMDLDPIEDKNEVDKRRRARKFFNHPKDSLMATIYALKAQALKQYWNYTNMG